MNYTYNILINRSDLTTNDIKVYVGNMPQQLTIDKDTISFDMPLGKGFHTMKVYLCDDKPFEVVKLSIDDCDCSHLIYTGYHIVNDSIDAPRTDVILNEYWVLQHIVPVSDWFSMHNEKFKNNTPHNQYHELNQIFYPESVEFEYPYPRIISDFYKHNPDYYSYSKEEQLSWEFNKKIPYVTCNIPYNNSAILKDVKVIVDNDLLTETKNNQYTSDKQWKVYDMIEAKSVMSNDDTPIPHWTTRLKFDPDKFKDLYAFLESIEVKNIYRVYVGILEPKKSIIPHVDSFFDRDEKYTGLHTLYFPLSDPTKNYFKLFRVGCVPLDKPKLINIAHFTHSVVNDSEQTRYIIGIRCDVTKHNLNKYLIW